MPRPRFEKLPVEKQEQILEAAAKEFTAHGYDGASLNRILEEAGISKGAAYYYFDDKADLYATKLVGNVLAFTSALERITLVNGMDPTSRSWRHFSVARRIRFLVDVTTDPSVERRFRRTMAGIYLATLALTLAAGSYVVWRCWFNQA